MSDYGDFAATLSPTNYWELDEASGDFIDLIASDDLTCSGTPAGRAASTALTGVPTGCNFGANAYAIKTSALTQPGTDKLSFAGWFNMQVVGQFSQPYFAASYTTGHNDPYYCFGLFHDSTPLYRFTVANSGSFAANLVDSGTPMPYNEWHHYVLVYNGTTLKLYIDGAEYATANRSGNVLDMGSFGIGVIPILDHADYSPTLKAAGCAYWHDTALTAQNAADLYDAGINGWTPPPTGPVNTVLPEITGTPQNGEVLSVDDGTWTGDPDTFAYQWLADGDEIDGEDTDDLTLTVAEVGAMISCVVTATNEDGSTDAESDEVGPVLPLPPGNTVAPVISGSVVVDETLSVTNGTWSPVADSYTYQWRLEGEEIVDETNNTLLLIEAYVGGLITCTVYATNDGGTDGANSNELGPVLGLLAPVNEVAPFITGTTREDSTLTCDPGEWDDDPQRIPASYSYAWLADGDPVGSDQNTFVPGPSEVGLMISCVVTAENSSFEVEAEAPEVGPVISADPFASVDSIASVVLPTCIC